MNFSKSVLAVALIFSSALSSAALAAESNTMANPQIMGDINVGVADYGSGYGAKFGWGAGVRAVFSDVYQVGVEYRRAKLDSADGADLTAISYLGNVMYRMPAGGGHFAFGIEAGETDFDVSIDLGGMLSADVGSVSKFAVGPKISYEVPVGDKFAIGVSVDDLIAFTDPTLNSVNALANLTYRF